MLSSHFISHAFNEKQGRNKRREPKSSPLGNIIELSGKEIESINIYAGSSAFDTGIPEGLGYMGIDGKAVLTFAAHRDDLSGDGTAGKLIKKQGGFIHCARGSEISEIKLTSPLLTIGKWRDRLDLYEGTVYRRIEKRLIDEKTVIRKVIYCGAACFAIDLTEIATSPCLIGHLTELNAEEIGGSKPGLFLSCDRKTVYFYPGGPTSLSEARAYLLGKHLVHILGEVRKEKLNISLKDSIGGVRYIEICTQNAPKFLINYKGGKGLCTQN